jgi:lysophospholipase L1-like esterase
MGVRRVSLLLAGLLLALGAAEIGFRLTGWGRLRPELQLDSRTLATFRTGRYVIDRDLFWSEAARPASSPLQAGIVIRGDPAPVKGSKYRILCLGDSCTRLAAGGPPYAALLTGKLGPDRVEVFNASLPGYSSHQGLTWLRQELLAWEPDLLIVYFGWNDHWRSRGLTDKQYAGVMAGRRLRLWQLLKSHHESPPLRVPLRDFKANLEAIADLIAADRGQVLFVTAPSHVTSQNEARRLESGYILPGDDTQAIHAEYQQVVRSLQKAPCSCVYDAASVFTAVEAPDLLLKEDGIHLTDLGHDVLAATLADFIDYAFMKRAQPPANPCALAHAILADERYGASAWPQADAHYRRAISLEPENIQFRLGRAWLLATCPEDRYRDGARALELLRNLREPPARDPGFWMVRAAISAELGRFTEAVEFQKLALSLLGDGQESPPGMVDECLARVSLYQSQQPYRCSP